MPQHPQPTQNVKMMYLIRRNPDCSREELIAHWFANHMPSVIRTQSEQAAAGKLAASRYIATLFEGGEWDGVAQLWFPRVPQTPAEPIGSRPMDSFQERVAPYLPWATREYVVLPGELPVEPLTLNAPFPTSRSGFLKITYLVNAADDVNFEAFFTHWLDVHAPVVVDTMATTGGFRYVVSQSLDPALAPYAGMAELYFENESASQAFARALPDDGISAYIKNVETYSSHTEFIGIP